MRACARPPVNFKDIAILQNPLRQIREKLYIVSKVTDAFLITCEANLNCFTGEIYFSTKVKAILFSFPENDPGNFFQRKSDERILKDYVLGQ